MKRLDRYLLGEMVLPFVGGILLIVVMLLGNTLYSLIQTIVQYSIPLSVVAKLVALNVPTVLTLTLPPSMAVASAWAVNRMARDSEVTPIRMAGVSVRRLFAPIVVVGVLCSLAAFWIGDRIAPQSFHEQKQTENQMLAYAMQASPAIASNKVFTYQNYAFHIREIRKDPGGDPNKLQLAGVTIFISPTDAQGFPTLITAQGAGYRHDVWTLHGVVVHTLDRSGFTKNEAVAPSLTLDLQVPLTGLAQSSIFAPEELTMRQLRQEMTALASTGQAGTDTFYAVSFNYYAKVALPCICLAFALCAPPLALRFARAGAYMGIFLSIVLVWVAWNTLLLTKFLGLSGKLDPLIAAWTPDILLGAVGLYFLWRAE